MGPLEWTLVISVIVAVLVTALIARRMPRGSGGAPGEVVCDRPLSRPTGASWDHREAAGPAEDRPGGPDAESMAPDVAATPAADPPNPAPEDRRP